MLSRLVSKYSWENMTMKHVLRFTNTITCNQNLHREVRGNFSQRTLNYEVITASGFWLGLTHKANFCLTYPKCQLSEEDTASRGTLVVHLEQVKSSSKQRWCRICSTACIRCPGGSDRPCTYWAREEQILAPSPLPL